MVTACGTHSWEGPLWSTVVVRVRPRALVVMAGGSLPPPRGGWRGARRQRPSTASPAWPNLPPPQDRWNNTALDEARRIGSKEVVAYLEEVMQVRGSPGCGGAWP